MNPTSVLTFGDTSYDLEDHRIPSIVDAIYPVGSIYMSVNPANPSTLFGGTWEQIEDTFLLAAGQNYTAGDTGGSPTHTLTEQELPQITQSMTLRNFHNTTNNTSVGVMVGTGTTGSVNSNYDIKASHESESGLNRINTSGVTASDTCTRYTNTFGGGQAHSIMPPYLAVYVWKRVADPE